MKYIVENWETEEIIKIFKTEEERKTFIKNNVDENGFCKLYNCKISIYDEF